MCSCKETYDFRCKDVKSEPNDRHVGQEHDKSPYDIHSDTSSSDGSFCSDGHQRRKRKRYIPRRSAERTDPNFKGAKLSLLTHVKDGDSFLFITAQFCNVDSPYSKRHHPSGEQFYGLYGTFSEEEETVDTHEYCIPCSSKTCASCSTRRTPLWRDADDGTPLCNACGIRFKKYRMRCGHCWHIPKKDVQTFPNCPVCGSILRIQVGRRSGW